VRHEGLTANPVPTVYLLHRQTPGYITSLVVRTSGDAASEIGVIRQAIRDVDRSQAVSAVKTMDQYLDAALARPRLYAALVTGFAALALILATLGVYGLLSYLVGQRGHEIGIRLALGADRRRVFRAIVLQALALTSVGLAIGIAGALALQRLVAGLLFGVDARDPLTYGLAAVAFLAAALLATMTPAIRAARIDPASALRCE
jgi:putative ABC transport system permease protein